MNMLMLRKVERGKKGRAMESLGRGSKLDGLSFLDIKSISNSFYVLRFRTFFLNIGKVFPIIL